MNSCPKEKREHAFVKMQGCGNDYIYFDCFEGMPGNPSDVSQRLSDRHFGVGGDGVVFICRSEIADAAMRMFNADGSEGRMCGNAIRCVGKFLHDIKGIEKEVLAIETLSGVKALRLIVEDGEVTGAEVDMGRAEFCAEKIPVALEEKEIINYPVCIGKESYRITCVSMGNPHCVVFTDDVGKAELSVIGPVFENHPLFPERINTEFVRIVDAHTLEMRVWERGSGETFACGTGACAAVAAAVRNGLCMPGDEIRVILRGGELFVRYTDGGRVLMRGGAVAVFRGSVIL